MPSAHPASLSTEQTAGPVPTATRQPPPCPSVLPGPESAAPGTSVSADPARRASELPAWAPRRGSCWPAAGSAHRQATPRCLPGGWQCAQLSSSLSCVWTCLLLHTQSRTHIYTGPHVYTTHTHTCKRIHTSTRAHTAAHTRTGTPAHTHTTREHTHTHRLRLLAASRSHTARATAWLVAAQPLRASVSPPVT